MLHRFCDNIETFLIFLKNCITLSPNKTHTNCIQNSVPFKNSTCILKIHETTEMINQKALTPAGNKTDLELKCMCLRIKMYVFYKWFSMGRVFN